MKLISKLLLGTCLLSPITQAADIGVEHGMLYLRGKLEQGDATKVYTLLNNGTKKVQQMQHLLNIPCFL